MANANDIITAVKQKVAPGADNPELYFAIETQIDPSLKKLAQILSETEMYVQLQKEFAQVVVSGSAGRAEAVLSGTDILAESLTERGVVLVGGKRSIPVKSYTFLEYPITDTSISRFFVAGSKIYLSGHTTIFAGGNANVNIVLIANYVPTVANIPSNLVGILIDIIAAQMSNDPETKLAEVKAKMENKDERG